MPRGSVQLDVAQLHQKPDLLVLNTALLIFQGLGGGIVIIQAMPRVEEIHESPNERIWHELLLPFTRAAAQARSLASFWFSQCSSAPAWKRCGAHNLGGKS